MRTTPLEVSSSALSSGQARERDACERRAARAARTGERRKLPLALAVLAASAIATIAAPASGTTPEALTRARLIRVVSIGPLAEQHVDTCDQRLQVRGRTSIGDQPYGRAPSRWAQDCVRRYPIYGLATL